MSLMMAVSMSPAPASLRRASKGRPFAHHRKQSGASSNDSEAIGSFFSFKHFLPGMNRHGYRGYAPERDVFDTAEIPHPVDAFGHERAVGGKHHRAGGHQSHVPGVKVECQADGANRFDQDGERYPEQRR